MSTFRSGNGEYVPNPALRGIDGLNVRIGWFRYMIILRQAILSLTWQLSSCRTLPNLSPLPRESVEEGRSRKGAAIVDGGYVREAG
jgi:hypothetical protein